LINSRKSLKRLRKMSDLSELSTREQFVINEMAQNDLYFFARWMFLKRKGYKWIRGQHHPIICDALMRVYRGEIKRLIINIPPRYSKTELSVVNFMAWTLGKVPDAEFIHTSYSGRLATNNSWHTREIVGHEEYTKIFPDTILRQDSQAKDEWRTTAGGIVYAVGAGGTITGYGAGKHREGFGGALVIDDPHKADEFRSDIVREGVIDWFQNTLESRLNSPNTPIILTMQRGHEHELAGWLIAGGNGEEWELIKLPALRDDGTALWPEKHSADMLRIMRDASPYHFAGQYQQEPALPEGNVFKPDAIEIIDALPECIRWMRGWDFAASDGRGDWTVGIKLGVTTKNRYVIADVVRLRGGPEMVESALLNTARRDGTNVRISIPQDTGQAGKAQAASMVKLLTGFSVEATPETGDKQTRAEPYAAQCNVGNVMMLRAPWNDALISEKRIFPNGAFDDQVDAASRAFNALNVNSFGMLDYYGRLATEKQREKELANARC
jgi:predicted phage terminase large subunit-like protein